MLDEKPSALDVFLHLGAAGAHLGLQALSIRLHLRGSFLGGPDLPTHTIGQQRSKPQENQPLGSPPGFSGRLLLKTYLGNI